jgi:hypothetical protein
MIQGGLFDIEEILELTERLSFRRGCYLEKEKPLKFFKKYMRNNCKSECLANRTVKICGCAQFFMVREPSTRICSVKDMKCYKKVEKESKSKDECDCLLECGEIEYGTELKQRKFLRSKPVLFNSGLIRQHHF